jgi:hypothetical protein
METWRTEWIQKKNEIALNLADGQCGGSYGEAAIILCAALSALAADVWPGRGIDRVRFSQLLKDFAPNYLNVTRVSIPLLTGYLRTNGRNVESDAIQKVFLAYDPSRILTGDDVDKSETELLAVCPTLSLQELREHSYANLLYGEIRSGYAHEYRPGQRADSWPMTQRKDATISYLNWVDDPDRHIHFHVRWISDLALAVGQAVDAAASSLPRNAPQQWWVHG